MSSRFWEVNKKMHHYTAKYVLKMYMKVPFCPDLRYNECVWDIGISNFVM